MQFVAFVTASWPMVVPTACLVAAYYVGRIHYRAD